jgi:hypothetical protein
MVGIARTADIAKQSDSIYQPVTGMDFSGAIRYIVTPSSSQQE